MRQKIFFATENCVHLEERKQKSMIDAENILDLKKNIFQILSHKTNKASDNSTK